MPQIQPCRSSFVTALAWIFIILAGFATFIAILQNVMISFFFPMEEMQSSMHSANFGEHVPDFVQFMFGHIQLFLASFFVLSASLCAVSVALLKRKNWARIAFIGFLALGIIWNVASLILQRAFFSSMSLPDAPTEFHSQFESMTTVMLIFSSIMVIGISLLLAWLIKRLASFPIKAEFQRSVL